MTKILNSAHCLIHTPSYQEKDAARLGPIGRIQTAKTKPLNAILGVVRITSLAGRDLQIESLSPHYDGTYATTQYLEANRPIFEGLDERDGKCMWWHRLSRHWWIGYCEDIGDNAGFAYIDEDLGCPSECSLGVQGGQFSCTWRSGESREVITGVTSRIASNGGRILVSAGAELYATSGAVGVNTVSQVGQTYKQSCKYVLYRGKRACMRTNQ